LKGIILAGGAGTRLFPLTEIVSKQLMPVYDKPMIYYPLSTLMLLGIREILLISTPIDIPKFESLLGDGEKLGISIKYKIQEEPNGIAQAFILGEEFIKNDPVTLILGDNLFYGHKYLDNIQSQLTDFSGALIFGYKVNDPERYGVVEFDENNNVLSIEEKPEDPKSDYAIPGLYIYDNQVISIAKNLKPSARGELEITDINIEFLNCNRLKVQLLGRGIAWLDTGTHKSLLDAGAFIETIESRQGLKIGCIEEIALTKEFISTNDFKQLTDSYPENDYTNYLKKMINN